MNSDTSDEFPEHPEETDKSRKKQINKSKWQKNIQKQQKYSAKAAKKPTLSCSHEVSHFCSAKRLSAMDLAKFHDGFWQKQNAVSQNDYLMSYINVKAPDRQRPDQGNSQRSSKDITISYRVQSKKGPIKVCRATFLSILNVGRRKVENAGHQKMKFCYVLPETRGGARHTSLELKTNYIIGHIKKFKCRIIQKRHCENTCRVN